MQCPRCGITAVHQVHRTRLERALTFMTALRKWECRLCGHRWFSKDDPAGETAKGVED
jgi:rubrerythrin